MPGSIRLRRAGRFASDSVDAGLEVPLWVGFCEESCRLLKLEDAPATDPLPSRSSFIRPARIIRMMPWAAFAVEAYELFDASMSSSCCMIRRILQFFDAVKCICESRKG